MRFTNAIIFLAVVFTVTPVFGASACPQAVSDPGGLISGTSNAAYQADVTGGADACNIIITFNADGSINTSLGAADPYDGIEDQLVGIINNSLNPITTIFLNNPGVDIFGFDADGICAYQPFVSNPGGTCNGSTTPTTTDPGDYLGTATSFSNISGGLDSGNVNFSGIPTGGTAYFSLEGPASLNLAVNGTPEPATFGLIGMGLTGFYFARRRFRA
jgi:hypothetical protein